MDAKSKREFKDSLFGEFARIGKASASERRLEILDLLAQGERSVEELAEETSQTVANTSQHLQVLKQTQLVEARRKKAFGDLRDAPSGISDSLSLPLTSGFAPSAFASCWLGIGTAMIDPTLLATIGDVAHPSWRASGVGVYRLWRDCGYALGALPAGLVADFFGIRWAIFSVGALTVISGLVTLLTMRETLPGRDPARTELPHPAVLI